MIHPSMMFLYITIHPSRVFVVSYSSFECVHKSDTDSEKSYIHCWRDQSRYRTDNKHCVAVGVHWN